MSKAYRVDNAAIAEIVLKNEAKLAPGAVIRKIVLQGKLQLASPLLIGSGSTDDLTDILVLKDKDGNPYIPGTSLAGVLRSWTDQNKKYFGNLNERQSCIEVEDIKLEDASLVIRDGVRIDSDLGTAVEGAKYDYEAVERGAEGNFRLEATIRLVQFKELAEIESLMVNLGQDFLQGVFVGANTSKGFGKLVAKEKTVELEVYDFSRKQDAAAWLNRAKPTKSVTLTKLSVFETAPKEDFLLEAQFLLNGSLIVRSGSVEIVNKLTARVAHDLAQGKTRVTEGAEQKRLSKVKAVQLLSGNDFVIPGSSIKGVLRSQAERIFNLLGKDAKTLDNLMGYSREGKHGAKKKSRLQVEEIYFNESKGVKAYPQTRNRIDRFTGATVESALFTQIPVWQQDKSKPSLTLRLRIKDCQEWEAGLLLFILKDLWTGQAALGGEKSIGRGTLSGLAAELIYGGQKYELLDNGKFEIIGPKEQLEHYASAFINLKSAGEPA